jgi:N utilization substance protein A
MNLELVGAINELEKERGISKAILFEAIEAAIVSAYKRNYGSAQNVRVEISDNGGITVYSRKDVVEEVLDEANEISLEDAKRVDPNYELDDIVEIEVTPRDFGRIAAQTAKQVVIQRIREAERAMVYEEYQNREGDIVTGIVQRTEHRNVLVDLGKVEAVLPPSEQIPRENYSQGGRMKVYISEVRKTTKGPQVVVSRTHPGLLKRLFEFEVPEIHDGVVEIRAVAREAGNRSKMAVQSRDPNVDPVGACVGPRGMRVQAVVQELRGEKIDIVQWDSSPETFVANSLSPARVLRVIITDGDKTARAVVPDYQLSLAIGKEGQNARLAARLCGWRIDIKSETQMQELLAMEARRLFAIPPRDEEEPEEQELVVSAEEPLPVELPAAGAAPPVGPEHLDELESDEADLMPWTDLEAVPSLEEPLADADSDEPDVAGEGLREEPTVAPVTRPKKSRSPKRDEISALLEEVEAEEEEELPSLFTAQEETGEPGHAKAELPTDTTAYHTAKPEPKAKATGKGRSKGKQEKKSVLKDLSELAKLIDQLADKE